MPHVKTVNKEGQYFQIKDEKYNTRLLFQIQKNVTRILLVSMRLSSNPFLRKSSVTSQCDFEAFRTRSRLEREKSRPDEGGIKRQMA